MSNKELIPKWERTGLLDGLNNDVEKLNMSVLLENKFKQESNTNTKTDNVLPTLRKVSTAATDDGAYRI